MASNEVEDGVANKEELERKNRIVEITQKEQRRYEPRQRNNKVSFMVQREEMERMMDQGY
jgi:hypothetical protein